MELASWFQTILREMEACVSTIHHAMNGDDWNMSPCLQARVSSSARAMTPAPEEGAGVGGQGKCRSHCGPLAHHQ